MSETRSLLRTNDYYIIDTRTPTVPNGRQVEIKDLDKDPDYADLKKAQRERKLAERFAHLPPHIAKAADNHHTLEMLNNEACNVEDECDEDGLIYFHSSKGDAVVKKWLKVLQTLDKDIALSKYGRQFKTEEETVQETRPSRILKRKGM